MHSAPELHDSGAQRVSSHEAELRVCLSKVYVHESAGTPVVDPGAGYVQEADCVFSEAEWSGVFHLHSQGGSRMGYS